MSEITSMMMGAPIQEMEIQQRQRTPAECIRILQGMREHLLNNWDIAQYWQDYGWYQGTPCLIIHGVNKGYLGTYEPIALWSNCVGIPLSDIVSNLGAPRGRETALEIMDRAIARHQEFTPTEGDASVHTTAQTQSAPLDARPPQEELGSRETVGEECHC